MHNSPVQARCSDEDSKACLSMQHLCRQSPVACLLFSYLGGTESLFSWTSEVDSCARKDSAKCGERLCPPCNASSSMSALCQKPRRNRLVVATCYSRMGLSSALIQHTSQGLRVQMLPSMRSQIVVPHDKRVVPGLLGYLPKCPTSNCRAHFGKLQVTCSTALGIAFKKNTEIGQRITTLDVYQSPVNVFT